MSALARRRAAASRHLAQAFTLVEVLVALAVVAVALSAGLRAAGSVTDNAARLADVSAAQWCADNQLGELRVRPTPNPNFRRVDAVVSHEDGRPLITVSTIVGRN